uniref:Putative secreted protein n=1 Tax=Ixodes ricinus TaxID=34613 RepID=A0A6B0V1E6_IXORI
MLELLCRVGTFMLLFFFQQYHSLADWQLLTTNKTTRLPRRRISVAPMQTTKCSWRLEILFTSWCTSPILAWRFPTTSCISSSWLVPVGDGCTGGQKDWYDFSLARAACLAVSGRDLRHCSFVSGLILLVVNPGFTQRSLCSLMLSLATALQWSISSRGVISRVSIPVVMMSNLSDAWNSDPGFCATFTLTVLLRGMMPKKGFTL